MTKVMMVGSAEKSGGGVSSVLKTMKRMPIWKQYNCYWLGTQIQRNYLWKLWYALRGAVITPFIIWRYDIIHFHTTPDRTGLAIQLPQLLAAKMLRRKVIVHIHMGNQLADHTRNTFFRWWLKRADVIVLLARKWQKVFGELFPDIKSVTRVVYNACEAQGEINLREKRNSIILMAFMSEEKGIDIMLKAWREIHERHPLWHVYMMGQGKVDHYRHLSEEMGLKDSMTFTGYITGEERLRMLREASISVMCSYAEGFPMTVLEAWTYGAAVVTTPVGGLPDVIEDGRNCLVTDFGNEKMLAQKLEKLMTNNSLREEMVRYSHDVMIPKFSLEAINNQLQELYRELSKKSV